MNNVEGLLSVENELRAVLSEVQTLRGAVSRHGEAATALATTTERVVWLIDRVDKLAERTGAACQTVMALGMPQVMEQLDGFRKDLQRATAEINGSVGETMTEAASHHTQAANAVRNAVVTVQAALDAHTKTLAEQYAMHASSLATQHNTHAAEVVHKLSSFQSTIDGTSGALQAAVLETNRMLEQRLLGIIQSMERDLSESVKQLQARVVELLQAAHNRIAENQQNLEQRLQGRLDSGLQGLRGELGQTTQTVAKEMRTSRRLLIAAIVTGGLSLLVSIITLILVARGAS
jgi:hypothetical protein